MANKVWSSVIDKGKMKRVCGQTGNGNKCEKKKKYQNIKKRRYSDMWLYCFVVLEGSEMPRPGDCILTRVGIEPGAHATFVPPSTDGESHKFILLISDSVSCRFSLARPDKTFLAKMTRRGLSGLAKCEYGYIDASFLETRNNVTILHYAISGLQFVGPQAPTAEELGAHIWKVFGLPKEFMFHLAVVRLGSNDIKFWAENSQVGRRTDV